jgi:6-phosphogluconolactonase/glucosamine-6-phosphate isomerase/deaminase
MIGQKNNRKEEKSMAGRPRQETLLNVNGTSLESKRARVTLILSQALDQNVELLCMVRGDRKADVVQNALRESLIKTGVANPDLDHKQNVAGLLKKMQ